MVKLNEDLTRDELKLLIEHCYYHVINNQPEQAYAALTHIDKSKEACFIDESDDMLKAMKERLDTISAMLDL